MVERFFPASPQPCGFSSGPSIALLSGPPSCGKTSLLFQFAINCAAESDGCVVFICNKRRMENKPPFLSQGVNPSSNALDRIQMKYVEDDKGIKKFFAAFHLYKSFPLAVIIDDFGDIFSERNCQYRYGNARGRDLAMVRTLGLCRDAISHANDKLQGQRTCSLVLSDTQQGDSPRLLFIYKRWVQSIFTIQGDGSGSFTLKTTSLSSNCLQSTRTIKYSVSLQCLSVEEILQS